MNMAPKFGGEAAAQRMAERLDRQKAANLRDGIPSAEVRIGRIDRALAALIKHQHALAAALTEDFGARAPQLTGVSDIAGSVSAMKHAKANLRRWMRPEKRPTTPPILGLLGGRAEIRAQPKGVVGIISPWNFPVNLTFAPLAGVLAAGNRAMIKPSEYTPATSEAMAAMFAEAFDADEIAVFTGGPEVGQAFSSLPFDHLVFTGATAIARHVMRAAAENLTPVTLELGGKSPAILGKSANYKTAAGRIMAGKTMNAGQICLAPDYVMAPADQLQTFVREAQGAVATMFPTLKDNPDYAAVIAERHYERIRGYVEDARAKGAEIVEINPAGEDFSQQQHRKIPPTLILNPTDEMTVMQEEIFGPVLPVKTYAAFDEAVAYVNAHDRPLGLYYFGDDKAEEETLLARTTSGGVTTNDVLFHFVREDLPFGGIGPSGMGSYHGLDGFREFSHRKAIYRQIKADLGPLKAIRPPYGEAVKRLLAMQIRP